MTPRIKAPAYTALHLCRTHARGFGVRLLAAVSRGVEEHVELDSINDDDDPIVCEHEGDKPCTKKAKTRFIVGPDDVNEYAEYLNARVL